MTFGQQIRAIRIQNKIPIFAMCDILGLASESEYFAIERGAVRPTTYQKIMLVISTRCPLAD